MKYVRLIARLILGFFMTYAGIAHLTVARQEFVAQVPTWIQFTPAFTDFVVLASGVVEIALGLSMLFMIKKYRPMVGALLALFYILIFPGNINQYVNHIDAFNLNTDDARLIRLFFQPVLIAWALWSTGGWKYGKQMIQKQQYKENEN
ncbi:DoxX family protein [Xylanibacter brevis]|uniref:DoxX family protein n=1 Tax=Xylanibacter brevis TaxID=83231 RepID=UPI00048016F8|nr:membrane protein [Xylanibacter brevis]